MKRCLFLFLAGSLLLLPVASYYAISWKNIREKYAQFVSTNTPQNLMPAGLLALGLAAGGLYYYLQNMQADSPSDSSFEVRGKIQGVPISQFKVYSQFSWGGGGNASCGYHTLLRGMQVIDAKAYDMSNYNLEKILLDTKAIIKYFNNWPPLGVWRQEIITRRELFNEKDIRNGDWLDDGELDFLWKMQDILPKQDQLILLNNSSYYGFTAIPDITMIGRKSQEFVLDENRNRIPIPNKEDEFLEKMVDADVVMPPLRRTLQEAAKNKRNYFHLLAIGTMQEGENYSTTEGHWYALVLHQKPDGTHHYFVMDSIGESRLNDERVVKLITAIEAKEAEGSIVQETVDEREEI